MVAVLVTATVWPVTMPVLEPTVATAVLLLVQVPPPVRSLKLVVDPEQTILVPDIATGKGSTVTMAFAAQMPKV